ncbi:MAG: 16S rRNA (cytosine(1402)-N(4))-methyltransferase RsmH [Patescibacteria group bacterium]|nr:16S rRNA (cytosine(1402)-N(4))-methyltransferase RsmH [Patescibacteria group bacterium]
MNNYHVPVLLREVIDFLQVKKGKKYIDATIGGGGHSLEILKRGGKVLGIDCDQEAIDYVNNQRLKNKDWEELTLIFGNFKDIDKIALLKGFDKVTGIIFDLGVSSYQLEKAQRGFSFQKAGPLDMRMDASGASGKVKAADLVNALTKGELYALFSKLGEERRASAISSAIVRARGIKPIESTRELAEVVQSAYGQKLDQTSAFERQLINKRIFQALRIAVNDELNNLRQALPKAIDLLEKNGRLLVISFHSLEDKIVKQSFIEFDRLNKGKIITKKPIGPSKDEMKKNRKSKSSKLRVFEKS